MSRRRRRSWILDHPFLGRVVICGTEVVPKVHLGPGTSRTTACGRGGSHPELTKVLARVTCGLCQNWIEAHRHELGGRS